MTTNATELAEALKGFIGTEQWFRPVLNRHVTYTEGVKHFLDNASNGSHWLLDILVTEPAILDQASSFAAISLKVENDFKAVLTVTDGNSDISVFTRRFNFTDCPVGEWKFFFTENVILLPSEY
jgi:hypothetical protein